MMEKPLKSYEWVSADINEKIKSGQLKPEEKLPSVVELASQYGVGRSTIREALSALKAKGLLDIRQGGGTFVKEASPEEENRAVQDWIEKAKSLQHVLELRRVIEIGCAQLAAKHRKEEDIEKLRLTLQEMAQHLLDERYSVQTDMKLHVQIAYATHNPLLIEMMDSLSPTLQETMEDSRKLWLMGASLTVKDLLNEHQAIVEAIVKKDEHHAAHLMEHHIKKIEKVIL
jgi:GntR family transcriptional repressor for pyruvate dehydrogenase complex